MVILVIFQNLFSFQTCQVAVNFWIYDKRKRIVVHSGSSRACGCNHHKTSIHAEQRAIEYLRKHIVIKSVVHIVSLSILDPKNALPDFACAFTVFRSISVNRGDQLIKNVSNKQG